MTGIIRYEDKYVARESTIKDALSELLGSRRQANAKFDNVVSYFHEDITDHEGITLQDIEEGDLPNMLNVAAMDGVYAVSYSALEKGYQQLQSEDEE